ncbi:MAG: HAMP domain-containing histidine kinase [Phaeodactylibacter sp.]|nr:HAMP domain-containing histidine kinase [Phaeodactylibacter sp.]MCB9272521.1 HAMP domain-containing histidine kinase [Lewinellaceae bacterium]
MEEWVILASGLLLGALAGWAVFRWQLRRLWRQMEQISPDMQGGQLSAVQAPLLRPAIAHLNQLLQQIGQEYEAKKQFTQDASHELQTPLAVIKAHIELLLQSPRLGEQEAEALGGILRNVNRLSRLNSALILLSKIDNQRFPDVAQIDIGLMLKEVLDNFSDLIGLQKIKVELSLHSTVLVSMSASLAEILLANLAQNAIRHNLRGGFLRAKLKGQRLEISNPGKVLAVLPEKLFERFERDPDSEQSLGLGLSIVQRICILYGFGLQYHHHQGLHTLVVDFSKQTPANTN